jgi:hypothetical protein
MRLIPHTADRMTIHPRVRAEADYHGLDDTRQSNQRTQETLRDEL